MKGGGHTLVFWFNLGSRASAQRSSHSPSTCPPNWFPDPKNPQKPPTTTQFGPPSPEIWYAEFLVKWKMNELQRKIGCPKSYKIWETSLTLLGEHLPLFSCQLTLPLLSSSLLASAASWLHSHDLGTFQWSRKSPQSKISGTTFSRLKRPSTHFVPYLELTKCLEIPQSSHLLIFPKIL